MPVGIVAAARDRVGRTVFLAEAAMFDHIEKRHPELRGCELAITTAIEQGIRCRAGNDGREKLYAKNIGPGRWLAVVVAYSDHVGHVITAYADKNGPKEADRI